MLREFDRLGMIVDLTHSSDPSFFQALDTFNVKYSICNVLHGSIALFNEDMAAALCAAVNAAISLRPRV